MSDSTSECVPYSEKACEAAGKQLGLTYSSGNWGTKGCYVYSDGRYTDDIFYGTGGDYYYNKKALGGSVRRPFGFDCRSGLIPMFIIDLMIYNNSSYNV